VAHKRPAKRYVTLDYLANKLATVITYAMASEPSRTAGQGTDIAVEDNDLDAEYEEDIYAKEQPAGGGDELSDEDAEGSEVDAEGEEDDELAQDDGEAVGAVKVQTDGAADTEDDEEDAAVESGSDAKTEDDSDADEGSSSESEPENEWEAENDEEDEVEPETVDPNRCM